MFIFVSCYEGYGMVYMEVMVYGLLVIGSGVGVVVEMFFGEGVVYCGVEDVFVFCVVLKCVMLDSGEWDWLVLVVCEMVKFFLIWKDVVVKFEIILK